MSGPTIDRELVLHVARLACLSLTDDEVERFARELQRIMEHVEQLDGIDTTNVDATAHISATEGPLRADELLPCLARDEVLSQAPEVDAGGFAVPAFLE